MPRTRRVIPLEEKIKKAEEYNVPVKLDQQ